MQAELADVQHAVARVPRALRLRDPRRLQRGRGYRTVALFAKRRQRARHVHVGRNQQDARCGTRRHDLPCIRRVLMGRAAAGRQYQGRRPHALMQQRLLEVAGRAVAHRDEHGCFAESVQRHRESERGGQRGIGARVPRRERIRHRSAADQHNGVAVRIRGGQLRWVLPGEALPQQQGECRGCAQIHPRASGRNQRKAAAPASRREGHDAHRAGDAGFGQGMADAAQDVDHVRGP